MRVGSRFIRLSKFRVFIHPLAGGERKADCKHQPAFVRFDSLRVAVVASKDHFPMAPVENHTGGCQLIGASFQADRSETAESKSEGKKKKGLSRRGSYFYITRASYASCSIAHERVTRDEGPFYCTASSSRNVYPRQRNRVSNTSPYILAARRVSPFFFFLYILYRSPFLLLHACKWLVRVVASLIFDTARGGMLYGPRFSPSPR